MYSGNTISILSILALSILTASCSDKSVPVNNNTPNPNVAVSVSPKTKSIHVGETINFGANVSGTSNAKVEWAVFSDAPAFGFISQGGIYTAPASIAGDSIVVFVEATSSANPEKADTARVVVNLN